MAKKKETPPATPAVVELTPLVRQYAPTVMKALKAFLPQAQGGCCCCCCCGDKQRPAAGDANCSVDEFDVNQELRLDPSSFGVVPGGLIVGTRADISWEVTAPADSTVSVQIRTRGTDGNPARPFADWTSVFNNQALIDSVRFSADQVLGTKVEFRVIVLDGDGQLLCAGPPDC